ncbi:hypothetical protein NFHSH190041_05420 [Shewanella sp. NFH-SH190041]|uniref:prepilin-type N-terminal cleavage/methylation domain-containing protein n=1 Tax=Shewanella sp. NFH-SH190041 TaxID=2950245 RepID=UPI0021C39AA3|nr:prepilin-type N-terminal cleavage/methylation domain-containing protein [Shewanella sp. NFH-SH190041]BDM63090.1 hypothetical protein NFHSH190041_05420 [Shewanella sp. NFH-SH190041]
MRKQQGFTLIELVIVIIILGILAVTAAPKFINLQSDARVSALQGVKGAIQSANSLVYSKAAISGLQASDAASVEIATGVHVPIKYGYMQATSAALVAGADIDANDWTLSSSAGGVLVQQKKAPEGCYFIYKAATSKALPSYGEMPTPDKC